MLFHLLFGGGELFADRDKKSLESKLHFRLLKLSPETFAKAWIEYSIRIEMI